MAMIVKTVLLFSCAVIFSNNYFAQDKTIIKGYELQLKGVIWSLGLKKELKSIKQIDFDDIKVELVPNNYISEFRDISLVFAVTWKNVKHDEVYIIFDISTGYVDLCFSCCLETKSESLCKVLLREEKLKKK